MSEVWVGAATDGRHVVPDAVLINVHPQDKCAGRPCVLHNPSDHHMKEWPTLWREDRRYMARVCPHDVSHPDPDDVVYQLSQGRWMGGHYCCDGCCLGGDTGYGSTRTVI